LDIQALRLIDTEIPYHILFILEYGGEAQVWIAYKEQNQTNPQGGSKPELTIIPNGRAKRF
jgi:hypothetical protein